jgi:hypothetical protein
MHWRDLHGLYPQADELGYGDHALTVMRLHTPRPDAPDFVATWATFIDRDENGKAYITAIDAFFDDEISDADRAFAIDCVAGMIGGIWVPPVESAIEDASPKNYIAMTVQDLTPEHFERLQRRRDTTEEIITLRYRDEHFTTITLRANAPITVQTHNCPDASHVGCARDMLVDLYLKATVPKNVVGDTEEFTNMFQRALALAGVL